MTNHDHAERLKSGKRGLHIGCGVHLLPGWLNADFFPQAPNVLYLDATRAFPFEEEEFDFIFSEHMIEHIDYNSGLLMISECFRVLRPGGVLRITTPNLQTIIDVYLNPRRKDYADYIAWAQHHFIGLTPTHSPGFFFNNFVRAWGHQFIYDVDTLSLSFVRSGFLKVLEQQLNESEHDDLKDLEAVSRMPPGFLQIESCTLEGTKPLSANAAGA